VDNGSSDGTHDILKAIARKNSRLEIIYDPGPYDQSRIVDGVLNDFTSRGEVLVIPFDADEFWNCSVGLLNELMARRGANVLTCDWVNFIQSRAVLEPSRWSWLRAHRRTTIVPGDPQELVVGHQCSFVQVDLPRKVVFRATGRVEIWKGAHAVNFDGAKKRSSGGVSCLHLPLRARCELIKRAAREPRVATARSSPSFSWQSAYWRREVEGGQTDREWHANSYDRDGCLDVFGRQVATFRDFRLVRLFLRAWMYACYLNVPVASRSPAR
jgi:hypothetical protein